MFAQPEAKATAREMINPPPPRSAPMTPAATPAEQAAEAGAKQGRFAHQVVGAMAPSEQVQKTFHKYTPVPVTGMPAFARWLSALAISRWGLEALSDLCLHGSHSTQDYAYKIVNTVSISLHPNDVERLKEGLEAPAETFAAARAFPLPSAFWKDKGPYLAIMAGFAIAMAIAILVIMKQKDVS